MAWEFFYLSWLALCGLALLVWWWRVHLGLFWLSLYMWSKHTASSLGSCYVVHAYGRLTWLLFCVLSTLWIHWLRAITWVYSVWPILALLLWPWSAIHIGISTISHALRQYRYLLICPRIYQHLLFNTICMSILKLFCGISELGFTVWEIRIKQSQQIVNDCPYLLIGYVDSILTILIYDLIMIS